MKSRLKGFFAVATAVLAMTTWASATAPIAGPPEDRREPGLQEALCLYYAS